jgi:hypothetical protein
LNLRLAGRLLFAGLFAVAPFMLASRSCTEDATCESYCALAKDCELSTGLSGAGCSDVCAAAEEVAAKDCQAELDRHLTCLSNMADVCGPPSAATPLGNTRRVWGAVA